MVMDARLGSVDIGASLLPLGSMSQSSVFCRSPVFRIRSDISLISDDELPESKAELFLDLDKKLHDNSRFRIFNHIQLYISNDSEICTQGEIRRHWCLKISQSQCIHLMVDTL